MRASVSVVARMLGGVADGWDAVVRAVRATPRGVRAAVADRGPRRAGVAVAAVVGVLYLLAIGDIAVSPSGRWAGADGVRFAPDGLFRPRAPYLFEPIVELHPGSHVAVFVSPVNVLLGLVVALLAGANIAVAAHGARLAAACRRPGYGRVLGAFPVFLLGFACCAPAFVLALSASTAAAVLPVLLPLRPFFYPVALVVLLAALVWGVRRLRQLSEPPSSRAAVSTRSSSG